jgi:hypothetical protein
MAELPGKGDKPNRSKSLDDFTDEERDEMPVQLNVRVPKYLRNELKRRTIGTEDTMEGIVEKALSNYLDI